MKIFDVLRTISSTLSKPTSEIKYRNISEDSIREQLEDIKWSLNITKDIFDQLSEGQQLALYNEVKSQLKMNSIIVTAIGKPCTSFILDIDRKLVGKARALGFFKSISVTTDRIITMVADLQTNTKEIINNKEGFIVGDIQMSQALLLGSIGIANIYVDFCMFLIAIFSHVMTKSKRPDVPKYMVQKITKNGDLCIDLINQVVNSPVGLPIVNIIMNIKKRGTDYKLSSADVLRSNLDSSTAANGGLILSTVAKALNALSLIGETYVDWRHQHYEMMKERKKWLENHIANIRLSLDGVDPNDPEYAKTLKIISFYEDKVAKYDKKLSDYYGEDYV